MSQIKHLLQEVEFYSRNLKTSLRRIVEPNLHKDWLETRNYVKSSNWGALLSNSQMNMSTFNARINEVLNEQTKVNSFVDRFFLLRSDYIDLIRPRFQEGAVEALQVSINEADTTNENKQFAIEQSSRIFKSPTVFFNDVIRKFEFTANLLSFSYDTAVTKFYYNKYAEIVAKVNGGIGQYDTTNPNDSYYYHKSEIEEKLRNIQNAIGNEDRDGAVTIATALSDWLLGKIDEKFLPILAELLRKRDGSIATEKQILRISQLIRLALTYSANMRWLTWRLRLTSRFEKNNTLIDKISNLSTDLLELPGSSRSIASLLDAVDDQNDVNVEGVVVQLNLIREEDKVISQGIIEDQNGKQLKFAIPYYSIDATGLVEGAYCKLSGDYRISNKEFENTAALSLIRYPLTDLSESSFAAWLRLHANEQFNLVPHNFCIEHTFELGSSGMGNPIRYNVIGDKGSPKRILSDLKKVLGK